MRSLLRFTLPLLAAFTLTTAAFAAESTPATPAAKRPLSLDDFDAWRSLASPTLSRDGRWLAYSFMPQDGDGEVVVREIAKARRNTIFELGPPTLIATKLPGLHCETSTPTLIKI